MPSPCQSSALRRLFKRLILCILLGAVLQYGVAVGFALDESRLPRGKLFAATVLENQQELNLEVDCAHAPGKDVLMLVFSLTAESGLSDIDNYEVWPDWSRAEWQEVIVGRNSGIPTTYRPGTPPSWLRPHKAEPGPYPDDVRRPRLTDGLEVGCGWPWRSSSFYARSPWPEGNGEFQVEDGLLVENRLAGTHPPRVIPLHIIWPGAAANTFTYAVALLIPFTLIPWTRGHLRRRAGRCPSCNYDLRGANHELCPECGAAITP